MKNSITKIALLTLITTSIPMHAKFWDSALYALGIFRKTLCITGATASAGALIASTYYLHTKAKKFSGPKQEREFLVGLSEQMKVKGHRQVYRKFELQDLVSAMDLTAIPSKQRNALSDAMGNYNKAFAKFRDTKNKEAAKKFLDQHESVHDAIKDCLAILKPKLLPYDSMECWQSLGFYGLTICGLRLIYEYETA